MALPVEDEDEALPSAAAAKLEAVAEEVRAKAPSNHLNGDGSLHPEFSRFCLDHGVSLDWLICGEGPKWIDRTQHKSEGGLAHA